MLDRFAFITSFSIVKKLEYHAGEVMDLQSIRTVFRPSGGTFLGDSDRANCQRDYPSSDARLHQALQNGVLIEAGFAKPLNNVSRLNISAWPTTKCVQGTHQP